MSSVEAPTILGRYALYEKIASGGMASVHIGRLVGPVGFARTVAIKRMHPQYAEDPDFVSMFLDEARVAARIRHPNVVPTLDVVATDGELFLVMDFIQGESLARLIRSGVTRGERIPPAMIAPIMSGVLHGLHAAHEAKSEQGEPLEVVHRDVSPHNILVGVDGVARVLDFGVAKAMGRMQSTREGQLKGKLAYMAPEQLEGTVTRSSDVYSAAVVLWEALTGKRLFAGTNTEAQLFKLILKGCTTPPTEIVPDVPPALNAIVMRGLAVDPANRFATAREMACAIEEAIAPAAASKIGDWVERVAKEALDQRSARVASIESDTSLVSSSMRMASSTGSRPRLSAQDVMSGVHDEPLSTQLSSASPASQARSIAPHAPRARGRLLVGVAAGVLTLVVVAFAFRGRGTPAGPPAVVVQAAAPPPIDTPLVIPEAPSTGAPALSSAPAEDAVPTQHAAAPVVRAHVKPKAGAPVAKDNCNPNFVYDADGNKIFKPECFGR